MDGIRHRRASTASTSSLNSDGQFHIDIRNILLEISEDITDAQMKKILFRLKDVIPDRKRESIQEPYQIFEFLENHGYISNTSLDYLIDIFSDLQYHRLAKKLKQYNLHSKKKQGAHKCILVGKSSTGKTSLCVRMKHNLFRENHYDATIEPFPFTLHIFTEGKAVPIHMWDTASMEAHSLRLPAQFYREAVVVLLVFDITCSTSFENTRFCKQEINFLCNDDVIIFLVGNKSDLAERRVISVEQAQKRASEFGAKYLEVSATNEETTETILHEIGEALRERNIQLDTNDHDNISLDASTQTNNDDNGNSRSFRGIDDNDENNRRFPRCMCNIL